MITNPVLPNGGIEFGSLLGAMVGLLLIIGSLAAFIFLLLGALSWITSSGDKQKLEKAQGTITSAILGLIILAAVWAIMMVVSGFLGLGIFTGNTGTFELPSLLNSTEETTGGGSTTGGGGNPPQHTLVYTCNINTGNCEISPNGIGTNLPSCNLDCAQRTCTNDNTDPNVINRNCQRDCLEPPALDIESYVDNRRQCNPTNGQPNVCCTIWRPNN